MPTFTAIAFDRLIEPRESKSDDMPVPNSRPPVKSKPVPNSKLERRNSSSVVIERKFNRPPLKPALYATPESTPLPDSPTSFPPSPYIINHKRRGPRLMKSFSQDDVALQQKSIDEGQLNGTITKEEIKSFSQDDMSLLKKSIDEGKLNGTPAKEPETKSVNSTDGASVTFTIPGPVEEEHKSEFHSRPEKEGVNGCHDGPTEMEHVNGAYDGESGSSNAGIESSKKGLRLAWKNDALLLAVNSDRDSEFEDFFDPQESMSVTSNTDGEDNTCAESSVKVATPKGEFYDAWEELSSGSGPHSGPSDIEAELRGIRLSLLMEIEKRKQAEEALNDMRIQWQRIRQELAHVGVALPADPTVVEEDGNINAAEELLQQFYLARFVSESIGKGIAKAEMQGEMDAQIKAKNFEIARLWDRLHYYEAMNREMSQRNQEAVDMARRNRQRKNRRQKWVWASIAAAITLGSAALAWSYLPTGKGSSSISASGAPEHDDAAKH